MADPNDRFSPGLSPGSGYGSIKNPSVKKSLLYRYNQSAGGHLDVDIPSPNPSIISDCPDLSSPETVLSLSSLRSPEAFPQVKSAESCDTTVSSESAPESLGSEANGASSITSPTFPGRAIKRPQPRRHRELSDTMLESKDSYSDLHVQITNSSACQTTAPSNSRDTKRASFSRPEVHSKELFTSHWAERVAAHHSADSPLRTADAEFAKDSRASSFNHCVEDDPYLQEVLYHHKHLAQRRSHELSFDDQMGELQALRERLALEHMIKGGGHAIDIPNDHFMPDQRFPKCPENIDRMPVFADPSDVFARVAMEQQLDVGRRRSLSQGRSSDRLSSSSLDPYPNSLLDLSMSQEKRQRLDNEPYKLDPSSPVSSSTSTNQADELPQQVPFIGPSGLKIDDQHLCTVCGDIAAGFHCGAYVCEACKKFFVRCLKQDAGMKFVCPRSNNCDITKDTRTQCQRCRYQKCITLGMYKPGGANISSEICHIPCSVCGAPSSGYHFGAITCEGCKGFFRRTIKERDILKYQCSREGSCLITTATRNICKYCRYQKCLNAGMKADGSRIGRQPNAIKHATMMQLKQIKSSLGLDTKNLPVKNLMPKPEPEMDDAYGQHPADRSPNSQSSLPSFQPSPPQPDYHDPIMTSLPPLQPMLTQRQTSPQHLKLSPPHMHPSPPTDLHPSPQPLHLSPLQMHPPPPQMNSSPQQLDPSPSQINDLHDQISDLSAFNTKSCELFSQTLNLEAPQGLFNEHTLGYMGTPPERPTPTHLNPPVKPLSPKPAPSSAQPDKKPNEPESKLPDIATILSALEKAVHELDPIRKRCDNPKLTEDAGRQTTWGLMMDQFKHSAIATLRFSKKIPGFRQMAMQTQIGTLQTCMFPIVMLQLSRDYDLTTGVYNYFNLLPYEFDQIMKFFPPFDSILEPFHYVGMAIKELGMTVLEIALLSAIYIMSEAKNKPYESLLIQALMEHERRRGVGVERHGLILLRLGDLVRANLAHQKSVIDIMSQPEKYSSLEIPQLFQETFFNSA